MSERGVAFFSRKAIVPALLIHAQGQHLFHFRGNGATYRICFVKEFVSLAGVAVQIKKLVKTGAITTVEFAEVIAGAGRWIFDLGKQIPLLPRIGRLSGAMFSADHTLPEYLLFVGTEVGRDIAGAGLEVCERDSLVA